MNSILTGLDRFREGQWKRLKTHRLGLLANQASLDSTLTSARDVIQAVLPGRLRALFGPQHGYGIEEQANMVATPDRYDGELGIPVFSLYGDCREPTSEMLALIDTLIIDLQDVGTRVFTFSSTMLNCLRSAARSRKKVLVLDRPNPLGGEAMEGNCLRPELFSFVGAYSLPMRHGLTMGEMARLFCDVYQMDCDLEIIPMRGWQREMLWHQTGLRWSLPSPNMPIPETALVYPGQVLWEGTNLSEGRGTCRPFEIFGAPFLNPGAVRSALEGEDLSGCQLQPVSFRPTFDKWAGEPCRGFMIHVLDPALYRPYRTSLELMRAVMRSAPEHFQWIPPPYEYEANKMPIDLVMGDSALREKLEAGTPISELEQVWSGELSLYARWRRPYLLYT